MNEEKFKRAELYRKAIDDYENINRRPLKGISVKVVINFPDHDTHIKLLAAEGNEVIAIIQQAIEKYKKLFKAL